MEYPYPSLAKGFFVAAWAGFGLGKLPLIIDFQEGIVHGSTWF
jgi:hypothetical protein